MSTRLSIFYSVLFLVFFSQCDTLNLPSSPTTTRKGESPQNNSKLVQNLIEYAKEQEGARYKYGGRSPRSGFDCSGFTYYVYDKFDLNLTPVSRVQETEGRKISLREVQAGDLVFFRRTRAGSVFHVALVVRHDSDGISVIHSTSSRGVVIDNITKSSYWSPKISTARRFIYN